MTPKQKEQFNRMRATLKRIANSYETTDHLRKHSRAAYGLDYDDALEYSYENVKAEAARAVKGVREV